MKYPHTLSVYISATMVKAFCLSLLQTNRSGEILFIIHYQIFSVTGINDIFLSFFTM